MTNLNCFADTNTLLEVTDIIYNVYQIGKSLLCRQMKRGKLAADNIKSVFLFNRGHEL